MQSHPLPLKSAHWQQNALTNEKLIRQHIVVRSLQHNFAELTVCIGLVLHFPYVSALRLAVDGRTSTKGEKVMQEELEVELSLMTDANAAFFLIFLGLFEIQLKLREDCYIFATASWLKAGTF